MTHLIKTQINNEHHFKYVMIKKENIKLQTGEITTNLYADLDLKVETINYEDDARKIRELEQKIAFMEK